LVSTPPWCQKPKRSSGSLMERGNRQAQEADRASHPHIGTRWRCFVLLRSHARAASRIPSEQLDSVAGSPTDRYPNSGIFFGCCATAMTATARSTTAIRIDGTAALFIADRSALGERGPSRARGRHPPRSGEPVDQRGTHHFDSTGSSPAGFPSSEDSLRHV
jgi:hypothetical protein